MATGCKIITDKDGLVHVSGHPAQEEVKKLQQILKPKIVVPVHGDALQLLEQKKLSLSWGAKAAFTLEEGDILQLNEDSPEIMGEVPVGCLAVDGKKIVPISANVIKKRRQMIDAGSVVATVVIDQNAQLLGNVQISSFGLLAQDSEEYAKLIKAIKKAVADIQEDKKMSDEFIKEEIRVAIRHFITRTFGKKPLLEVHLIRI